MRKEQLIIVLLSVITINESIAQNPDWVYYNAGEYIRALADNDTIMWVVNSNNSVVKLNKSTGAQTYYSSSNSDLPHDNYYSMAIDSTGGIWIGTNDSGAVYFNGISWTTFNTTNSELPNSLIYSIHVDRNSNVLFGTYSQGIAIFDGIGWTVYNTSNSSLPHDRINCITSTESTYYFGTAGGLACLTDSNWTVYNTINSGLLSNSITSICIDHNGNLWIGTNDGLVYYNWNVWNLYTDYNSDIPSNYIKTIAVDDIGIAWIGVNDDGLIKFNGNTWIFYNTSNSGLPNNEISCIIIDEKQNKWIGTEGGGLVAFKEGGVILNSDYLNNTNPVSYKLLRNHPNPFNQVTTISYNLPEQTFVILKVYDILGREIATLVNHTEEPGYKSVKWDSTNDLGEPISAGIYIYQISAGDYIENRKLVLLK